MAAASETKTVPVEEWLTFLTTHKFKKDIRDFEKSYSYRPLHSEEFPKREDGRANLSKPNSEFLIIIPNPTNIQQFYGILTNVFTSPTYGTIPQSFLLTYNPESNKLTYQRMTYGFYDHNSVGPHPIPTPTSVKRELTIPELLETINTTKQMGGSRRRSRKAKKKTKPAL